MPQSERCENNIKISFSVRFARSKNVRMAPSSFVDNVGKQALSFTVMDWSSLQRTT